MFSSKLYGYLILFLIINCAFSVNNDGKSDVETDNRYELKNEIRGLKELVKKQSKLISDSAEKITRLEQSFEALMRESGTYSRQGFNTNRAKVKIERGQVDQENQSTAHKVLDVRGPIAFVAYMKHFHTSKEYPPGSILPFELTTLNYGNYYNKTSGLFTCPISGLYKLDWALAYFHRDSMDGLSNDRNYTLDVDFTIVYLNKSDTAGVTNPDDNGIFMPYFSKFSGFKISG